jgi:hypothetical protein
VRLIFRALRDRSVSSDADVIVCVLVGVLVLSYGLRAAARIDLRSHAPRNTRPPESFAS